MRADLAFLFVFILLVFLTDAILYRQLQRWFEKRNKLIKLSFYAVFWIIPVAFSAAFVYFFSLVKKAVDPDLYVHFSWLFGMFLIVYLPKMIYLFFILIDYIRIKIKQFIISFKKERVPRKGEKITRSQFLGKAGIIIAAIPFASMIYGMSKGRYNFYLRKVKLPSARIPKAFDGFKIIQISDLHLGNFNREYHRLYPVVDIINEEKPDLILFTGDLVNNFKEETEGWAPVFTKMKARYGKYSILGNHDYGNYSRWSSPEAKKRNFEGIVQAHQRYGFKLLRNENLTIEHNGNKIALAGNENWGLPPFPQYGELQKTIKGIDPEMFTVLMSHDPDHWEAEILKNSNADLTLAGHTHGMQMGISYKNLNWSPAKWKYKYWDGLYSKGDRHIYVNRGLGFIGLPMRIGMPPEITLIELKSV